MSSFTIPGHDGLTVNSTPDLAQDDLLGFQQKKGLIYLMGVGGNQS